MEPAFAKLAFQDFSVKSKTNAATTTVATTDFANLLLEIVSAISALAGHFVKLKIFAVIRIVEHTELVTPITGSAFVNSATRVIIAKLLTTAV